MPFGCAQGKPALRKANGRTKGETALRGAGLNR